jgi:hypothetical protein
MPLSPEREYEIRSSIEARIARKRQEREMLAEEAVASVALDGETVAMEPEPEPEPEPAPSRPDHVELWCQNGAHHWQRPKVRGVRPHNCPEHR